MLYFNGLSEINSLIVSISPMLLAQTSSDSIDPNSIAAFSAVLNVTSFVFYVIGSFLSWKIFQKINVENAWFTWIPILNFYITLVAGDDENPVLWTILGFIPCVNIISLIRFIGAWIKICNKLGKSPWLLLLCIIPLVNFCVLGYLAFA